MFKKSTAAALSLGLLAGCEAPLLVAAAANDAEGVGLTTVTFPAKMLLISEERGEELYAGTMKGSVAGHADFDIINEEGVRCVGRAEKDGLIQMNCDGADVRFQGEPAKKAFSGVRYSVPQPGMQAAFGWGKGADEGVLRLSMTEKRDISAKEARSLNQD